MSGKRAAEACCACGGGKASTDDYAPPPPSYDYAPPDLPQPPLLPPRDPLLPPPPTPMPPPPSPSLPPSSPPPSSPSSEPPFVIWSGEWWSKVAGHELSHGVVGGTVGLATLFAVGCCVICRRRSKARGRSRVAKNKQHLCGLLHYTCPYNYVPLAGAPVRCAHGSDLSAMGVVVAESPLLAPLRLLSPRPSAWGAAGRAAEASEPPRGVTDGESRHDESPVQSESQERTREP